MEDSEFVLTAGNEVAGDGVQALGLYGVLGAYDFAGIVGAPDNNAAARLSIRWGAKAQIHVTTLPAIPISRFEGEMPYERLRDTVGASFDPSAPPVDEWEMPKLPT